MAMTSGLSRDVGEVGEGAVIDVRGLRMRYGSVDVLRGVDFVARRGEVLALLGPNGAGKTTTIEILEGFRMRSAGEVRVLGLDPAKGDERWRARVGVVLQSWRDHGKWRVRELLSHLGRYYAPYCTPERKRPYDVDELIETVGLGEQAGRKISSGSIRTRGASSTTSCIGWRTWRTPRYCLPRTIWTRPRSWPIGS